MPRPPTIVCYICHREYGRASFGIHEKSCLKKWHAQNNQLPPSKRLPEPTRPDVSSTQQTNGLTDSLKALETAMKDQGLNLEASNTQVGSGIMGSCAKCGRHFALDRLSLHQSHCKPPPKPNPFHAYEARKPEVDPEVLCRSLPRKILLDCSSSVNTTQHNNFAKDYPISCQLRLRVKRRDCSQNRRLGTSMESSFCRDQPLPVRGMIETRMIPSCGCVQKTTRMEVERGPRVDIARAKPKGRRIVGKCPTCRIGLAGGSYFCTQCGQAVRTSMENDTDVMNVSNNAWMSDIVTIIGH